MATGGCGGFFASVRAIGVTGQQQHAFSVSPEETVRGGAEGSLRSAGGGTKPASSDPSPAFNTVPAHRVAARSGARCFRLFMALSVYCLARRVKRDLGTLCGPMRFRAFPPLPNLLRSILMNAKRLCAAGLLATCCLAASVRAGSHHWGLGGRYHVDHSEFAELPFGDGDVGYGLVYEFHDGPAYWQLGASYAPDITGTNAVDTVITPFANLILKDGFWRAGAGLLGSYIDGESDSDWTDPYWQLLLGVGIPLFGLNLDVQALYSFESWSDIGAFDMDDIEYGAWLTFAF
jgi:hypothetical protein